MEKLLLSNTFKLLFLILLTNNNITAQVTPTFPAVSPICAGGTLSPLPTTSNNGITGTWTPALNNLTTTTYFFTPTAGQNANSTTLTINVNSVPAPTFTLTQPTCSNQTGTIEITSPLSAGFTYSIDGFSFQNSTTFSNLPSSTYNVSVKNSFGCISNFTPATILSPPNLINPIFFIDQTICAGETIAILPTVSFNGVIGTWTPETANNLETSFYTFTPSPGICANTTTLTITVNPLPTIASFSTSTNFVCAGTKGTLNFTGTPNSTVVYTDGTSTFSVFLDAFGNATIQTPNNLNSTTTFSLVSITSNDAFACTNSSLFSTVLIQISNGPIINSQPTSTTVCEYSADAVLSVVATGSGLTYVWKKGSSIVANSNSNIIAIPSSLANIGFYSCTVTDACGESVTSNPAYINVTAQPFFTQNPTGTTICSGQVISLMAETTGFGVSYKWFKGMIDLSISNPTALTNNLFIPNAQTTDSGDYTCVAKNGPCSVISSVATIMITAINTTLNLVGSTITSNQANATYQWIDCVNGNATIVGQNSQSFTPTTNGQYAVNIQFNNCVKTSECITIDFLEVDNFKNTSNIQLFPNPTASILNIQMEEKIIDLKIIDITGRTTNFSNYANNKIDVSNLSSGMYFVTIKTENGLFKEKFIKQ